MREARDPRHWGWLDQADQTVRQPVAGGDGPVEVGAHLAGEDGVDEGAVAAEMGPLAAQLAAVSLDAVRDNTVFQPAEQQAWFQLLAVLRTADSAALKQLSLGETGPLQLMRQTGFYRGKVVSVAGRVRRAHYIEAPANDRQIEGYWQLWFQPGGAAQIPVVVYSLSVPPEMPLGTELDQHCRLEGVLFKRWAYISAEGSTVAPLVLAGSVQMAVGADASTDASPRVNLPLAALVSLGIALCILAVVAWQWRQATELGRLRRRMQK